MSAPTTPTYSLVDHHGHAVTSASYQGSWQLVFFGFTHCRAVCPRALGRLSTVLAELRDLSDRIRPLYITVDPDRDTPPVMRDFLRAYPAFTGLTGSPDAIDAAKREFRVFARRRDDPEDPDGYAVPHTAITYLLSPDGRYVTHFPDSMPAEELTAELRRRLN
ncbi:SCO family protein [Kutzneria sp. CA-103260]|uniref:SCO family protein n=1 Tax=Kutzneria sp. CA-103260 TaxID=2802641 RepID=UPI001BABA228|nr:SCO family protein [Kutzneria sp. CA-103260]QUQ66843.1 SCO family protein [Kutzneria sp. CA-103260]